MKLDRCLTILLMLTALVKAWGGNSRGNGGIVLVCDPSYSQEPAIQIFDYYEGSKLRGISNDLGPAWLSVEEKVTLALSRLAPLDPERAERFQGYAQSFEAESLRLHNVVLTPLDDAFPLFITAGCHIEQVVNQQRQPQLPTDPRYIINDDLWNRLNRDNVAGLILHEIVYREALAIGQSDSRATRAFVQYLTSHLLEPMDITEYETLLGNLRFHTHH